MMDRWGDKYTHGRSAGARPVERTRADRVRSIFIIVLAVALVGVGIVGGQAIAFRNQAQDKLAARALVECSEAVNHVNSMSRSGGSDTAGMLGKIRANIKAVDVLSSLSQSMYGRPLVAQSHFTDLYAIIDSYSGKLKIGTTAIDELTRLSDGLNSLQTLLQQIQ